MTKRQIPQGEFPKVWQDRNQESISRFDAKEKNMAALKTNIMSSRSRWKDRKKKQHQTISGNSLGNYIFGIRLGAVTNPGDS